MRNSSRWATVSPGQIETFDLERVIDLCEVERPDLNEKILRAVGNQPAKAMIVVHVKPASREQHSHPRKPGSLPERLSDCIEGRCRHAAG